MTSSLNRNWLSKPSTMVEKVELDSLVEDDNTEPYENQKFLYDELSTLLTKTNCN
jgi:hypothetical protein